MCSLLFPGTASKDRNQIPGSKALILWTGIKLFETRETASKGWVVSAVMPLSDLLYRPPCHIPCKATSVLANVYFMSAQLCHLPDHHKQHGRKMLSH